MKFLILFSLILLIIAIYQLIKVLDLVREHNKIPNWKVTDKDNSKQGLLFLIFMFLFFGCFFWQVDKWADRILPEAASEHGLNVDALWNYNIYLVTLVFFLVNAFLFIFAYKYAGKKGVKATYFAHDNRLEVLWTIVPSFTLAFIIIYGLKYWNEITSKSTDPNKITIELYAKQFDWTARYAGKDKTLGATDYRQTSGSNEVGIDTLDANGFDDMLVKNEIHIPVNQDIELKMRSRDVIHSAYLPHFRVQMNCVPGMVTEFKFKPIKTTAEMRKDPYVINLMNGINTIRAKENKEPVEFDYILLCNKICGSSHYNMQMTVVVESEADYKQWLAKQKTFKK